MRTHEVTEAGRPHYVLCLEDEPMLSRSIANALRGCGHRVLQAATLEKAQAIVIQEGPPAVLLADLHLPDGSGVDLLVQMADDHLACVGILMTAYPDLDSTLACINRARALRYVQKPLDLDEMVNMVATAMKEHLVREQLVSVRRSFAHGDGRRRAVYVEDLAESMVLDADVRTSDGLLLAPTGAPLTRALIERLVKIARSRGVDQPLLVHEASQLTAS